MSTEPAPLVSALVMAASRSGVDDPVAQLQGKSHKCLVEIDGRVMLERVVEAMLDSGCFARVHVSVESPDILAATPMMQGWMEQGRMVFVQSHGNLADSVLKAAQEIEDPLPLVITTGDNALHTPEIIRDFVAILQGCKGDGVVGFTREEVVMRDYADSGIKFHRLKGDAFSSCNLYGLKQRNALNAVKIFEGGGQFAKRNIRILKAFGVLPFIVYKLKLTGLEGLLKSVSRSLRVSVDVAWLDYPWGPIDVDNKRAFDLAETTLAKRREAAAG